MKPSVLSALVHFQNRVLPKQIRDTPNGKKRLGLRKVTRNEDVGVLFPYLNCSFRYLAPFGIGVGAYFLQLFVIGLLSLISGCIMIPSIKYFSSKMYDFDSSANYAIGSAACSHENSRFNATTNCPHNAATCEVTYISSCDISKQSIICDLAMVFTLFVALYFKMGLSTIEDRLDEAVQTAQDYSVVVKDPPSYALDSQQWYEFFGRFGKVMNITIAKNNRKLCLLLLQKILLKRYIRPVEWKNHVNALKVEDDKNDTNEAKTYWERCRSLIQSMGFLKDEKYYLQQLVIVNNNIEEACKETYLPTKVFVSFETEVDQRFCLEELGSSLLDAINNNIHTAKERKVFNKKDILMVSESDEPDNIHWMNLENSEKQWYARSVVSWIITGIVIFLFIQFALQLTFKYIPSYTSIVISGLDMMLPMIFNSITYFEQHDDEDDRQNSLLVKLFFAKLITAVFFNYAKTAWSSFIDAETLDQLITIQLSACFVSPVVKAMDLYGVVMRWVVSPMCSANQSEMNTYWEGTPFYLADRYTELAKIVFMGLFYSFLIPTSLFVASVACMVLFLVDRFLLLRRCSTPQMMDATMAFTMRNYMIFAICAHLYTTSRFIYAWPFDSAYVGSDGSLVYADKSPSFRLWHLTKQPFHSEEHSKILGIYVVCAITVISAVLAVVLFEPLYNFIKYVFFSEGEIEGSKVSLKSYRDINVSAYCPTVTNGTGKFIVADTDKMLPRYAPETILHYDSDIPNLADMLTPLQRSITMSQVVWYGDQNNVSNLQKSESFAPKSKALMTLSKTATDNRVETHKKVSKSSKVVVPVDSATLELNISNIMNVSEDGFDMTFDIEEGMKNENFKFLNDEITMLRMIRKEIIQSKLGAKKGLERVDRAEDRFITYAQFLSALQNIAPQCAQVNQATLQSSTRTNRTIFRRIYVKFIDIQYKLGSTVLVPNNMDWPIFLKFVENGDVMKMKYDAQQQQQQK